MTSTSDATEELRKDYCPPIDDAVFFAIASDYDLPKETEDLAKVLDDLKAAAYEQESSEFDPSGTGGTFATHDETDNSKFSVVDGSGSNGVTSITTGLSDLAWGETDGLGEGLDNLSNDDKIVWLQNMFPDGSLENINTVFNRSKSLEQATDELLNHAFVSISDHEVEQTALPIPKGIEGFVEGAVDRPRKGRSKKKLRTTESSRASSAGSHLSEAPASPNVWTSATHDVEFIGSRTSLPLQTVKAAYHKNGSRLTSTIKALAAKEASDWINIQPIDPVLEFQIAEFKQDFPAVPDPQIYGLLCLARYMPSATYELLEAITAVPISEDERLGRLHGVVQYAPLELDKDNQPISTRSEQAWSPVSPATARDLAAAHGLAAGQAFSQASSAFRRGRSDRLMGGAAAYYASVGHERIKAAKELHSTLADAHVNTQSSATVLDLHGVTVADAVRIANQRTNAWWTGLGDAKYASGGGGSMRAGYKIITGVGTHSKNHTPRIGPAVSKMLVREGWRVEIGRGELLVTGKARR